MRTQQQIIHFVNTISLCCTVVEIATHRMAPKISYELVPADRYDDVIQHLATFFLRDEPMLKSIGQEEGIDEKVALKFAEHVREMLANNYSVMALDENGVIAGVLVNDVLRPGYVERSVKDMQELDSGNLQGILKIYDDLNTADDWFAKFHVDAIFENHFLSVDSGYRQLGIARELVKRSEDVARKAGFKLLKGDLTGIYSQRIFATADFVVQHEIYYKEFVDEQGKPFLNVEPPHVKIQLTVKEIA